MRARRLGLVAVATLTFGTLVACGASEEVTESTAATTDGGTVYPLTLDNCGETVTVDAPPSRVVSLDQDSTEILLSLGLQDRMVGTASWTDPVRANLAEANATVPRLADNAPTYEVVLDTEPDFVTASFGRHYKQGGVAERARFTEVGAPAYLSPTDCDNGRSVNGGTARTTPLTMDSLYQEITELAAIFDVNERGAALVDELKSRVAAATEGVESGDLTAAFWFADTTSPYIAGGYGAPNLLATSLDIGNAGADIQDDWAALGWESVVDRDPSILVLGDLTRDRFPGDRLADKIAFLESDPVTSTMTAVREKRYLTLHGAEMNPSIQLVDGLEKMSAGLRELDPSS
ncbi:ABC transporter substrate-binding protein [Rhodococcoides corynebacterioides]|uniref:ABC transporter substrate-binding protein n=1 Tax=Rhodococcoides corynebacterioides TaxID=53972 RepID=UPI00082CEA34|nr:ABC transporter substrate-binding protein [Rhodococcus corynebacterioides]